MTSDLCGDGGVRRTASSSENDGDSTARSPVGAPSRGAAPGPAGPERGAARRRRIRHSNVQSGAGDRAHPAIDRTILTWLHRTRIETHAHHHRVLHRLKLRAPGRQVGGRARAAVPRRDGRASTGIGGTIRSFDGRLASLPEVEARTTRGVGRDRELVARSSLSFSGYESGPMRRLDALARGTSHPR